MAKEFDTDVEGIDANPLATRMAEELAVTSGTAQRLRFKTGDISNTGWSDHSFDGALSMDVLLFVPDKRAALQEVARILKLGSRFVGTTWSCVPRAQRCPLRRSMNIPALSGSAALAGAGSTVALGLGGWVFTQIILYKSRAKPRPAREEWFSMVEVIEKFSKTPFGVKAGVRRR